jgi:hypothetical protein
VGKNQAVSIPIKPSEYCVEDKLVVDANSVKDLSDFHVLFRLMKTLYRGLIMKFYRDFRRM